MAVASTVTVDFKAKTAKFENGIKKAKKSAGGFGKAIAAGMRGAAIGTAALTGATAILVKQSLALVDVQTKTARTLGTTQRIYAGLSLAAEVSGVSVESFSKALKRQSKSIIDANDGLQTQARAFQRLGLETKDLIALPVEEQFKRITQALGTVENKTIRVAAASDIFGAKNADLINILELGADGLDKFIQKVDELGIALTQGQTKAIEDANDANTVLKKSFQGLGNQLAAQFAPAIKRAAESLTRFVTSVTRSVELVAINVRDLLGLQKDLNVLSLAGLRQEYALTQNKINDLNAELQKAKSLVDVADASAGSAFFINQQDLAKARVFLKTYEGQYAALGEQLAKNIELQKELLNPEAATTVGGDGGGDLTGDMEAKKFQTDLAAAIKATENNSERLQRKLNEIRDNLRARPMWPKELAGKQAQLAVDEYIKELKRIKSEQESIIEGQKARADAAARSVATPLEALKYALADIRAEMAANPFLDPNVAQRQAEQAVEAYLTELERLKQETENAFEQMSEFQKQAFQNMQTILADYLFDPFQDGIDGMLKQFVIMLRKMVAQLAATQILEWFFGLFKGNTPFPSPGGTGGGGGSVPKFAIGGRTDGGMSLVGENGPELFAPGASGSIRPIGALSVVNETNINGGGGLDIATLIPILEENNRKVKGEILDAMDRGAYA